MNVKIISLVIIGSIFIGVGIVFIPQLVTQQKSSAVDLVQNKSTTVQATPQPSPTPLPISIDQSSDLEQEAAKLMIPDFSADFADLKAELQ